MIHGKICVVRSFQLRRVNVTKVYVEFNDRNRELKQMAKYNMSRTNRWVPVEKSKVLFNIRRDRANSVTIKSVQFPLTLSFACTIHKLQGLSLQKDAISFALNKEKLFRSSQMYVILSRITNLSGMYLNGKYTKSAIKFNVGLSPHLKNCVICFIESPLKVMKNAFYFILKALFSLKILEFLSWLFFFGNVEKRLD